MRPFTRVVAVSLVGVLACIDSTDPSSGGQLQFLMPASAVAIDSGRVVVTGPTTTTVKFLPGERKEIGPLQPGTYTVSLEGYVPAAAGGGVGYFKQITGVSVVKGQTTAVTVPDFPTFQPTILSAPAYTVDGAFTIVYSKVQGAASYVVQRSASPTFSPSLDTSIAAADTSVQVSIPVTGPYNVRVLAITPTGAKGQPSAAQSVTTITAVTVSPGTGSIAAGATQQFTAVAKDAQNNPISGIRFFWASSNQNVALVDSTGLATGVAGGLATISALGLGVPGSAALTVTGAGAATRLAFVGQPTTGAAGAAINPAVLVAIVDAAGNTVTTATDPVRVSILSGPGQLLGTLTASAVGGVASFSDLKINQAASGYSLLATASNGGLTPATSAAFNITPGPTVLVVVTPAGATITTGSQTFSAQAFDAFNNVISGKVFTWASLNTGTATINSSTGVATSVASGQVTVSATVDAKTGYGLLTVAKSGITNKNLWKAQASGTNNELRRAWGMSSSDLFAVGDAGTIRRFTGASWVGMTSPTGQLLTHVWGTSSSNVFAVGGGGTIIRYNGTSWTAMTSPTSNTLWRLWGSSPSDVFAVGLAGTILHFDGTTWSQMASVTSNDLFGVWGTSSKDVFAVGTNGTIRHFDGTSWSPMAGATFNNLRAVGGTSPTNVFAVGANGTIIHFDGSWSPMTGGGSADLWEVWAAAANEVFVPSAVGSILRFNGSSWSPMITTTSQPFLGIWGTPEGELVATGGSGVIHRSRGAINVAGMTNTDVQQNDITTVFSSGDLAGTFTELTTATFNAMTPADLRAAYDVLLFRCCGADLALNADWTSRLVAYMNLGGGIVWEDVVNLADLAPGVTATAVDNTGAITVSASVPGLTNGIANGFVNSHIRPTAWDAALSPFMIDAGPNTVGLYGRFGTGCIVLSGPDNNWHGIRGAADPQGNMYQLFLNSVKWVAGC